MIDDYREAKERRGHQFAHYLKLMDARTHDEAQSDCYMVISERQSRTHCSKKLARKRQVSLTASGYGLGGHRRRTSSTQSQRAENFPDAESSEGRTPARFVQWWFMDKDFVVGLPNTTIFEAETRRLLRDRSGFLREAENPELRVSSKRYVEQFDPILKFYMYGDERNAAEDTAFMFFDLWQFPVDSRLFVKASSFRTNHRWELGTPIE